MEKLKDILMLGEDPSGAAAPLNATLADRIDEAIAEAAEDGKSDGLIKLINPLIHTQGKEGGDALLYTAARVQSQVGDRTIATRMYVVLCERLEQREDWGVIIPIVTRALAETESTDFARLVARIWEKGGGDHVSPELLRTAFERKGEDHRVQWAFGSALMESGEEEEGRSLIARSLLEYAQKKNYDRLEEGVLYLSEGASKEDLGCLLGAIDQLMKQKEFDRAITTFDFCRQGILDQGLNGEAWTVLRKHLEDLGDSGELRKLAAEFGPGAYGDVINAEKLFQRTGIADTAVPINEALEKLDKLLELPAGRHVYHHSWGVGQITDNDGEYLFIRFAEKSDHKMSLNLANTALLFLEPTDLRVKMFEKPDEVRAAAKKNRVELLHHVLEHMGGEASRDEIRKLLVRLEVLASSSWSEWWKNAKRGAETDPRFDLSQAFRNTIRLRKEGESVSALPEFSVDANFRKGLGLLISYLEQHPDGEKELADRYAPAIHVHSNRADTVAVERVMGLQFLDQIGRGNDEAMGEAILALLDAPDLGPLSPDQQKALLSYTRDEAKERMAHLLLTSRVVTVRREAWQAIQGMGDGARKAIVNDILSKSPKKGNAVLHLVKELQVTQPALAVQLVHALLPVLEEPEREPHRKEALAIVESEGFQRAIRSYEPTDEECDYLRTRLSHWKHSERYLFPVLEAFQGSPLERVAREVEGNRASLRPTAEKSAIEEFGGRVLISRGTLVRLQKEVEELDWDLKTTIPQMIRKAREHGDLKENAEYDAARQKQRDSTERLEKLYGRIQMAKPIEDFDFDGEIAMPGTEVEIRSDTGEEYKYWILGEGDRDLGDDVISYLAPLGMILLGKRVGEVAGPFQDRTFTILSIRKKLPAEDS